MATLSTLYLTMVDWAKLLDPDGTTADIVDILSQNNEILEDMTWMECNNLASHQITQLTGLPAAYYRLVNAGTLPSKGTTAQIMEGTSMLETYSQIDCKLVEMNKSPKKFRLTQSMPHREAMNQRQATTLFYGNAGTAPEEFNGLSVRYSSLTAGSSQNVINAGGVGSDNCSVWLCQWGDNTLSGIFPTGSKVGLYHEDKGKVLIQNANGVTGALLDMYVDKWGWDAGLALINWRDGAVRICNIDASNLVSETSAANLTKLMIKATYRPKNLKMGRPVFYMNRTAAMMLDVQRTAVIDAGGAVTIDNVDGRRRMNFRGIPIKIVDALTTSEALVT